MNTYVLVLYTNALFFLKITELYSLTYLCTTASVSKMSLLLTSLSFFSAQYRRVLLLLFAIFNPQHQPGLTLGYPDHLLCNPASCLRPRGQPRGWAGPATVYSVCCESKTGKVSDPLAWGAEDGEAFLQTLFTNGYSIAGQCSALDAGKCDAGARKILLHPWDTESYP